MNATKLHININQGLIDVEGSEEFVRSIYEDFKEVFVNSRTATTTTSDGDDVRAEAHQDFATKVQSKKPKRRPRRASDGAEPRSGWSGYRPQLDNTLETASLSAFFARAAPKSHADKILTFVRYLNDELSIRPCSADQIYTCYRVLREKMPEAFVQAFRDTQNKNGFIEAPSPTEIIATIVGDNRFEHDLVKP